MNVCHVKVFNRNIAVSTRVFGSHWSEWLWRSNMAEAAVQESAISRFFCHKCSVEIPRVQPVSSL